MQTNFKEQLHDERPYWKVIVSLAVSLIGTILFIYVGYRLLAFFMPFVIGWFLAYVASPLVNWLEKRVRIVKKLGSALIIILVLAGVGLLCYFLGSKLWQEIRALIENMPGIYRDLESGFYTVGENLEGIFEMLPEEVQEGWQTMISNLDQTMGNLIGRISEPTMAAAGNFAKRIPSIFIGTIVTFISSYFFIAEREEVIIWAKKVAPDPLVERMSMVMDNLKYAVGGYFKAQFKIMIVVCLILIVGFVILDVHFYFLLAILIALLDFLPFFGTGTALIPWGLYKLMVGDYKMVIGLVILYGVTQLVRQLIQPKLVGDSMGLKPLLTLVFLYAGYKIGGVIAMIFAVPIGMILMNLYKAGAFDYILDDVKILMEGLLKLRE
ncbi:sporulation integral membrane protein YtvI [Dorea sp. ICN-14282]|uniref:sporulation integral membrane protein YtvI n=1 Tax=Dorea sp. ICN-14282 TaxID=3134654 RepID=UPI0030BE5EAD